MIFIGQSETEIRWFRKKYFRDSPVRTPRWVIAMKRIKKSKKGREALEQTILSLPLNPKLSKLTNVYHGNNMSLPVDHCKKIILVSLVVPRMIS